MTTVIPIIELGDHMATRTRGAEASERLKSLMDGEAPVEVAIMGDFPVTLSFLDEIVRQVDATHQLDKLTFLSDREDVLYKLGRLVEILKVRLYYRAPN